MTVLPQLTDVALNDPRWLWGGPTPAAAEFRGRECLAFADSVALATLEGLRLSDGLIEVELAVTAERSFHGIGWHARDVANYESFFVRPHQIGNPDAIQYTPVTNGISSWQLYHGEGFWAPIVFPLGDWFTIRAVLAGNQANIYVADLATPTLEIPGLKHGAIDGNFGIAVGGSGLRVAWISWAAGVFPLHAPLQQQPPRPSGVIPAWQVSAAFPETVIASALRAEHAWTQLEAEPSGLVDLARASGISGDRNTVLARAKLVSIGEQRKAFQIGYSDRAVVFLNGEPMWRGDATYRSRDYRFLGSIGYWDIVHLPLQVGENELCIAVSETFGGWGIQGRLEDVRGVTFG